MASETLNFNLFARDNASKSFDKLGNSVDQTQSRFSKLGAGLATFGKLALGAGAVAVAGGFALKRGLIDPASDLSETINKVDVVFGKNAKSVLAWSKTSATSFGLSQQAALAATGQFGDMFHQLGFTQKASAKTSESLVKTAADLGSFHNVDPSDVLDRIGGALRGEYDSLQQLIPNINAARVETEALKQTGKEHAEQLTAQEKATAVLSIVQRDGANAANDFAETSGGAANQQRIFGAQVDDLRAKLGAGLLPVFASGLSHITAFVGGMQNGTGAGGTFAEKMRELGDKAREAFAYFKSDVLPRLQEFGAFIMGTVVPALGQMAAFVKRNSDFFVPFVATILAIAAAVKVWVAIQTVLNFVLTANPIGLVVVAIAALVAGLVLAYRRSETFRDIVNTAFHVVAEAGKFMWGVLKAAFSFITDAFLTVAGAIINGAAKMFGWVPGVGGKLKAAAEKFNDFASSVRGALDGGAQIGADFVRGVANGIRATTGLAVGAAGDMANKVAQQARNDFQESSPSKVGIEIGEFFSEGVAVGIKARTTAALEAVKALTDKVTAKLQDLRQKAASIRQTAADAVRGMFDFGGIGATTTGTDAEGNPTSSTANPVQQFADFASQSQAFAGAVSQGVANGLDPRIMAQAVGTGNLTVVQSLASLDPASAASVNRDFALAQKMAAQVGATVLSTTRVPDDIAREQGQLDTLKAIRADLKAQRPIEIHVHDATDPDAVVAAIRRYIKKNGLLRNVAAP